MATRAAPARAGLGGAEHFFASAFRLLSDIVTAVADGIRAHKDFRVRVGQGADPVKAVAIAVGANERH